uniref:ATP synthase subunit 6 n=1 Tax=Margaritifera margaritifera TaxID=102329 RepID=S4S2B2_PINMG|nr:ATP synthase subunit 6 [Pinctada margaritifera]
MMNNLSVLVGVYNSKMFLVSVSFLVALVSWSVFWGHMMSSDFWLGGVLKLGFLSMSSLLVDGIGKIEHWCLVKGVLSRLVGVHLCLLTVGLSGLLPFSFQGLVQLKSLGVAFGSIWLSLVVGFFYLRGSLMCVEMVVSMPLLSASVVMVFVEVLSTILLILVMPVRMGGNMLVGEGVPSYSGYTKCLVFLGGGAVSWCYFLSDCGCYSTKACG